MPSWRSFRFFIVIDGATEYLGGFLFINPSNQNLTGILEYIEDILDLKISMVTCSPAYRVSLVDSNECPVNCQLSEF